MTAARHNTVFKTLTSDRSLWWLPGLLSLLVISAIVFAPAVALLRNINSAVLLDPFTDPWLQRVIIFSFYQAFLSTVLSVVLAMPLAHILALHYPDYRGRVWNSSYLRFKWLDQSAMASFSSDVFKYRGFR